nr:MAG TPA: hypothetical protein [Caudoviricetes sp.]
MLHEGRVIVAVFKEDDKDVGVAQISLGPQGYFYGVVAKTNCEGHEKSFKDCVDILEESVHNQWCLIWTNLEDTKKYHPELANITGVYHVDLYELTERVNYESARDSEQ